MLFLEFLFLPGNIINNNNNNKNNNSNTIINLALYSSLWTLPQHKAKALCFEYWERTKGLFSSSYYSALCSKRLHVRTTRNHNGSLQPTWTRLCKEIFHCHIYCPGKSNRTQKDELYSDTCQRHKHSQDNRQRELIPIILDLAFVDAR